MSLYEKNYTDTDALSRGKVAEGIHGDERVAFIKQTYQLLAASMIAAAAGAYATLPFAELIGRYYLPLSLAELAILFFGLGLSRGKRGLNLAMLFLFTFLTGVTLVPLLASLIGAGKGAVIGNAFLSTSVLYGALSIFAINSKTDFSNWGKPLFVTLIVIILATLANLFFFHSPIIHIVIMAGTMLLFGLFTIYDTQNIANGAYDSPVDAAVSLYLDFLNMFIVMLQFFGIAGDD
jgi:modulator of FtsH protease